MTLRDALYDVDFTVATTARGRAKFSHYATPAEAASLMQEKTTWMNCMALVFGREVSGLTNEELVLADLLTSVPMVAGYPSLNLSQAVMVYCYQLSGLVLSTPPLPADGHAPGGQLRALRHRCRTLLARLDVAGDQKLADWIEQRLGILTHRDTAMMHRLLHDIEKKLSA